MLRLAFDFIITWRETRTRPNAYQKKQCKYYISQNREKFCFHGCKATIFLPFSDTDDTKLLFFKHEQRR